MKTYKTDLLDLRCMDCMELMRDTPDNSVDSVVTDPPYGLSFMGKKWDYDVPSEDVWRECLRVLKPGGHLLAFAGTRTQHRMAVRIEDAGFEIRDMVSYLYSTNDTARQLIETLTPEQLKLLDATFGRDGMLGWGYGSGFPKSLNVGKAIDKCNGETGRLLKFTRWMRATGATRKGITDAMIASGHISSNGTMAGHYFAETEAGQPAIPTRAIWATVRPHCGDVPAWVDELVDRIEAEREVVGKHSTDMGGLGGERLGQAGGDITAPATEAAKQWEGWGTALKPALEPITVARKPFPGTVAANVLEHGTGAINVDGCRVGGESTLRTNGKTAIWADGGMNTEQGGSAQGRWPANLILTYPEDEYTLRDNVTPDQLHKLADWINENAKH